MIAKSLRTSGVSSGRFGLFKMDSLPWKRRHAGDIHGRPDYSAFEIFSHLDLDLRVPRLLGVASLA